MRLLRLALLPLLLIATPLRAEIEIVEVTSPGGLTAWLVEEPDIPFTALEIRFQGGTSLDLPGKRGAINLMAALLEEGAGELDAQGFAEARDALAASFRFRAGSESVSISARFLTENRDQAVDLLHQAIIAPRFDQDALDRVRGQVLAGLAADAKNPDAIASARFAALAYGDHPYGSDGDGTPESVGALTRADIVEAHQAAMARDRLFVAAAGDITPAELGALLDRLFEGLPELGRTRPGPADWRLPGGVTVESFPTPQSVILFGHEGIRRDDPDFFPAFVLNEVLGGSRFSARLMTELREKRGLTYGIGTALDTRDHGPSLVGQLATSNDRVTEAIELVHDEWARLAAEGITAEELTATKTYLTGAYPLRFDGNGQIAAILAAMQMEGQPIDYVRTRNAQVEAVTLDDVKRVAARLLRPDDLHFVVVGQPSGSIPAD